MGTSFFAVPIFEKLASNYDVRLAVCTPDKPGGRGHQLIASPIKISAQELNIQVEQPTKLKGNQDFIKKLKQLSPDLVVVAAYGKILPESIINLPEHGCLNVHASLLPKYRGASPIQTCLLNGDKQTGISIMLMDLGMDTGDIVNQEEIEINNNDNFNTLSEKLSSLAAQMIDEAIPSYIRGETNLEMQNDDDATYCYKIDPTMAKIKWVQSAKAIDNLIRAVCGKLKVYTFFNDKRLNIIEAYPIEDKLFIDTQIPVGKVIKKPNANSKYCVKCGKGALELKTVQIEGKKPTDIENFINGYQNFFGSILN